ncbi:hypothetical protein StoSoilB20_32920 [Arthrobacter sp. StoSoilB20]|nr:hypothetical protein StoSoilB20_32920 [Arthrobacter sp. StoSoilB20]
MADSSPLLTIVLEESGTLDRESVMYRRLVSARLRLESEFTILHIAEPLTTASIARLCNEIDSKYVVFMRTSHQLSTNYVTTMLDYLRTRTVYLAEPVIYTGPIPNNVASTKIDQNYHYGRDTDVFGTAFNTRRLADALEAIGDIDRAGLYISYRLYWSLGSLKPLPTGFSVASETKAAIGLQLGDDVTRLVPLIATSSTEVRLHLVRFLAAFLRGLRAQKVSGVSLAHLRDVIHAFDLAEFASLLDPLQPFEGSWLRWLNEPEDRYLYKQLSDGDSYLVFHEGEAQESALQLYRLRLGDDVLTIEKAYVPRVRRPGYFRPASYDFYSRPIDTYSTILFFDRPLQADDNAEHLYEYFINNHPEYKKVYFALNPKSEDWDRLLAKNFKLVPIFTPEFYEKFLISDLVVSSQIYNIRYKGKSFANSRFVYLQHGVQLNDMTDWVLSKYFDIFVATGQIEADYLSKFAPVETLNSGLPRMESLARADHTDQHLLFLPTWRFNLHQSSTEHFTQSSYFRSIDAILSDASLLNFLERTGRTLHVKLHPNVEKRASHFRFSDRVVKSELSYREAISSAEMVFTDYSSAVIDAAFIGTPIAYYQWDSVDFFNDQPYEGRLDFRKDGLGPVFQEHSEMVNHIVNEHYTQLDDQYAHRRARFFKGVDPARINSTIIERMLSL